MLVQGILKVSLIIALLFNNSINNKVYGQQRSVVRTIQSPRTTDWGTWRGWQYCPDGSFASGMELMVEDSQGEGCFNDDTGLNAIRLICGNWNGNTTTIIESNVGNWGHWRGKTHCDGLAYGFQLNSQFFQGNCGDDSATNDMRLLCATHNNDKKVLNGAGIVAFGTWTEKRTCPSGTAICGIRVQVEEDQGRCHFIDQSCMHDDDTALNNVDMACCNVPDPATTCDAEYGWRTIYSCSAGIACKVTTKSSLSYTESRSASVTHQKEVSEELGFSLGASKVGLTGNFEAKFGNKQINGVSIVHMISTVSTEETTFEIDMAGCQKNVQQMVLTCGIYKIKTNQYQCN